MIQFPMKSLAHTSVSNCCMNWSIGITKGDENCTKGNPILVHPMKQKVLGSTSRKKITNDTANTGLFPKSQFPFGCSHSTKVKDRQNTQSILFTAKRSQKVRFYNLVWS